MCQLTKTTYLFQSLSVSLRKLPNLSKGAEAMLCGTEVCVRVYLRLSAQSCIITHPDTLLYITPGFITSLNMFITKTGKLVPKLMLNF